MKAILQAGRPFANLRWILRPSLVVFSLYWLSRLAFILRYPESVKEMHVQDLPDFIFLSLRFDLSLFFTLSLLPFLLLLLPLRNGMQAGLARLLFTLTNGSFLLLNNIDLYFFAFNGRRTDWPTMRFLLDDSLQQLPQLILHYFPVPLFAAASFFLIWKSFPRQRQQEGAGVASVFISSLLLLATGIGLIRNSLGQKPLLPGNAFILQPQQAGHAALNTGFVLLKTLESSELEKPGFMSGDEMLRRLPLCKNGPAALPSANLVLIILESFATEYTGLEKGGAGQTPFLDSLARAGLYFPHHYACGRTSRDALPAILASLPPWMDESFAASPYVSTELEGLGSSLQKAGYRTAFFHGGKNGTMAFDLMSRLCGFSAYYGMNEYPDKNDFDGNWGIFDGPFLQYCAKEINHMQAPFAAGIFTLSSHQPYTLPAGWKDSAGTGGNAVYKAVRYADQSLRDFFRSASKMPWYKNTLFVLTADHTHEVFRQEFRNHGGYFDVPLILFAPGKKLSADTSQYLQHSDIAPAVLDLLGHQPQKRNRLSHGFLSCPPLPPMQYQDGNYSVLVPDGRLIWNGKSSPATWQWESYNAKPEPDGLRRQTMARLQYYRNGLIENRLFRRD